MGDGLYAGTSKLHLLSGSFFFGLIKTQQLSRLFAVHSLIIADKNNSVVDCGGQASVRLNGTLW